jgi:hypothetical protein
MHNMVWPLIRTATREARRGSGSTIPDDWGTVVNVQHMVFGNKGKASGSKVAFSRDEVTGEPEPSYRAPVARVAAAQAVIRG